LDLLSLPKNLGLHPIKGKEIKVGIGRFGPYVVCDGDFRSVPKGENFLKVTFERALELLNQPKKGRGGSQILKELGAHPGTGEAIQLVNGPYGPYLKMGKRNQSLPEGTVVDQVTLEQAVDLIGSVAGPSKASSKAKKKTGAKKVAAKTADASPVKTASGGAKKKVAATQKPMIKKIAKKTKTTKTAVTQGHR
jgi:DNA topoisomerase-1